MSQWYLSYGGQQSGPMSQDEAISKARSNPNGHAWKDGFKDWLPISQVPELSGGTGSVPPSPRSSAARRRTIL